jgi:hypothetical protein
VGQCGSLRATAQRPAPRRPGSLVEREAAKPKERSEPGTASILKWRMRYDFLPDRFGSRVRRLRYANLVHPQEGGETDPKIAAPSAAVRKDGSHDAPSHRSELPGSANGSMAKGPVVALDHGEAATSALTECAFSWKFVTASNVHATAKIRSLSDASGFEACQPSAHSRDAPDREEDEGVCPPNPRPLIRTS